ncbi:MAG: alpha/beta hydrolase [Myxococcaceae bacterium]|nr:alpha/beta hydrolase [Myxococcaceae bacterium]MCI0671386.1 alpha/beta hydrolase [Myxococcaceae bacterium]
MRSCTADIAGPVHYADFGGEGPPIVLVHGLGGSHLNWMTVAGPLTRFGRVVALDLAGFGRTPLAGRSASVEASLGLLEAFLTQVVGAPAVLFGNSMGGLLSLALAAKAPERVRGLVLVNPAQPRPPGVPLDGEVLSRFVVASIPGVGEWAVGRAARKLGGPGLVRDMLQLCCRDMARVPRAAVEAHVALASERLATMPWSHAAYLEASRTLVRFILRPKRFRPLVEAVRCPTLLLHGAHDRLVHVGASESLARSRPDWRFEVFPDAGHVPQLEETEGFVSRVGAWLGELAPAPARAAVG